MRAANGGDSMADCPGKSAYIYQTTLRFVPAWVGTPDRPASSLVTIPITLFRLPA
jgi:hypothetical protein